MKESRYAARRYARVRHRLISHPARRRHPIGPFIVDFACTRHRLVIEADGGQHDTNTGADQRRTAWLSRRGWRVLRFWNNDILAAFPSPAPRERAAHWSGPPGPRPGAG
ncbi:MAG: endonuclease domain-containing protein [Rhodospirillales bacterium]|nr:endonuclease domain-containing protein [Rhodospirillales bacterium]